MWEHCSGLIGQKTWRVATGIWRGAVLVPGPLPERLDTTPDSQRQRCFVWKTHTSGVKVYVWEKRRNNSGNIWKKHTGVNELHTCLDLASGITCILLFLSRLFLDLCTNIHTRVAMMKWVYLLSHFLWLSSNVLELSRTCFHICWNQIPLFTGEDLKPLSN